ncbi:MAG: hypothetical protein ACLU8D_11320 [Enterocloster sp.]
MKRQEWILLIVLAITVMASVLVGVGQVYITGMEGVRLKADQTLWLFFETAALFGISFFIIRLAQTKWLRFLLLSFMTMGFLWIHQVFLPVLVSGAYLAAVIRCGSALRRLLDRHRRLPEYHGVTCMADLTLGCGLHITVSVSCPGGSEALETPGWRSWSCWPCRFPAVSDRGQGQSQGQLRRLLENGSP